MHKCAHLKTAIVVFHMHSSLFHKAATLCMMYQEFIFCLRFLLIYQLLDISLQEEFMGCQTCWTVWPAMRSYTTNAIVLITPIQVHCDLLTGMRWSTFMLQSRFIWPGKEHFSKDVVAHSVRNSGGDLMLNILHEQVAQLVGCWQEHTTHSHNSDAGSCLQCNGEDCWGTMHRCCGSWLSLHMKTGLHHKINSFTN